MSTPLTRSEFGVTQQYVYLNHAAAGVLPASTVAAIEQFVRAHAAGGVLGTFPYDLQMTEYRAKIGGFIGASGSEIATLLNTGAGANTVALGIDWKPADEVVLCDNEFPANVIPWLGLRRRGVDVRLIPTREERLTPERLRRELSPRTRVVAVSWVSYADGYRHDLAGLAAVAHEAGALLCVDAMQGLGVFPLDVHALGVDALYAGAGKVDARFARRRISVRELAALPTAWKLRCRVGGRSPTCGTFTTTSSLSRRTFCASKVGLPTCWERSRSFARSISSNAADRRPLRITF